MGGKRKEGSKPKLRERREAQRGAIRSLGLVGAVAMALLGVWGAVLWQGGKVVQLSTEAPATQLRKVVSGVPPWLLHCKTKTGGADSDHLAAQAAMTLKYQGSEIQVGTVDCDAPMPSGKSLYQKYFGSTKSEQASRPQFMVAANGDPMQKLGLTNLMLPSEFVRYVQKAAAPKVRPISTERGLQKACFQVKNRPCLMVTWPMTDDTPLIKAYPWLNKLLKKYRDSPLGWVDSATHQTSVSKQLPDGPGPHLAVLVRATNGSDVEYQAKVLRDVEFEPKQLEKAIVAMRSNQLEMTTLRKKPGIRRIVEDEYAKQFHKVTKAAAQKPKAPKQPSSQKKAAAPPPAPPPSEEAQVTPEEAAERERQRRDEFARREREASLVWEAEEEWEEEEEEYEYYDEGELIEL